MEVQLYTSSGGLFGGAQPSSGRQVDLVQPATGVARVAVAATPTPTPAPTAKKPTGDWLSAFADFTEAERVELGGLIDRHGMATVRGWLSAWAKQMLALSELKERALPDFDDSPMGYVRAEARSVEGIPFPTGR